MNQDEIIEMAFKAGVEDSNEYNHLVCTKVELVAFAKLIAEKEREACAKEIQQSRAYQLVWYPEGYSVNPNKIDSFYEFQWKRSMDAIRARGEASDLKSKSKNTRNNNVHK